MEMNDDVNSTTPDNKTSVVETHETNTVNNDIENSLSDTTPKIIEATSEPEVPVLNDNTEKAEPTDSTPETDPARPERPSACSGCQPARG